MEPSVSHIAEKAIRGFTTAIVVSGAFVALAIFSRPGPPRYQAVVADGRIVRIDTRSGTIISCQAGGCTTVLKRGQRLERKLEAFARERAKQIEPAAPRQPAP